MHALLYIESISRYFQLMDLFKSDEGNRPSFRYRILISQKTKTNLTPPPQKQKTKQRKNHKHELDKARFLMMPQILV